MEFSEASDVGKLHLVLRPFVGVSYSSIWERMGGRLGVGSRAVNGLLEGVFRSIRPRLNRRMDRK